jgi:type II secretory pathway component PulJ
MRLPRVRFTVRRMMVAVTLVAILLAVVIRRRDYCLRMAARYAQEEARTRSDLQSARALGPAMLAVHVAAQHGELRRRYQRAASRPWEPLPDDPFLNDPPGSSRFDQTNP